MPLQQQKTTALTWGLLAWLLSIILSAASVYLIPIASVRDDHVVFWLLCALVGICLLLVHFTHLYRQYPGQNLTLVMLLFGLSLLASLLSAPWQHWYPWSIALYITTLMLMSLLLTWWILRQQNTFLADYWQGHHHNHHPLLNVALLLGLILLAIQSFNGILNHIHQTSLVCLDFPRCQQQFWFELSAWLQIWEKQAWLDLHSLSESAQIAMQLMHRWMGSILFLYLLILSLISLQLTDSNTNLKKPAWAFFILLLLQIILPSLNIAYELMFVLSLLHHLTGLFLIMSLLAIYHVLNPPSIQMQ